MSTPQPPAGGPSDTDGPEPGGPRRTYRFHGEELDFDPYRFGAPDSPPATAAPAAPGAAPAPGRPGQTWHGGGGGDVPTYSPGDYWGGPGAGTPPPGPTPGGSPFDAPAGYGPGDAPPPAGRHAHAGDRTPYPPTYPPPYAPPHPGPYGRPAPGGAPGNGLAVAGFVLGCATIPLLVFTVGAGSILAGIVGLVLAVVGLRRSRTRGGARRTLATWGVVLSAVGIVVGTIYLVWALQKIDFGCVQRAAGDYSQAQTCIR